MKLANEFARISGSVTKIMDCLGLVRLTTFWELLTYFSGNRKDVSSLLRKIGLHTYGNTWACSTVVSCSECGLSHALPILFRVFCIVTNMHYEHLDF